MGHYHAVNSGSVLPSSMSRIQLLTAESLLFIHRRYRYVAAYFNAFAKWPSRCVEACVDA